MRKQARGLAGYGRALGRRQQQQHHMSMGHPGKRCPCLGLVLLLLLLPSTTPLIVPLRRQGAGAASLSSFLPPLSRDKGASPTNSTTTPTHLRAFIPGFYAYFAQLSFGNEAGNEQAVDVLIDTGSHDLLIPTDLCTTCSQEIVSQRLDIATAEAVFVRCDDVVGCVGQCTPSMLEGVGLVNRADSPAVYCGPYGGMCEVGTESCLFVDYYADGSHASGVLVTVATVDFAGVEVDNVIFGAINSASDSFFEAPQGGGIMGMAFREPAAGTGGGNGMWSCDDTPCVLPLLDTLVAQQEKEEDVRDIFAIFGHSSAPVMLVGASSVEEEARGFYEGEVQYARMVQPHGLYMVAVAALGLREGGKEGGIEREEFLLQEAAGSVAIIDTGATGLFFPKSAYLELKTYLQTHYCHVPFICGPETTPLPTAAAVPPLAAAPAAAATAQKQEEEPHRSLRRRHHHRRHRHPPSQDEEGGEEGGEDGEVQPTTIFDEEIWAKYDEETLALLPTLIIRLEDGGVELRLSPKQYLIRNTFLGGEEEDGEMGEVEGGEGGGGVAYYHFGVATLEDGGEEDEEAEEKEEGGREGRKQSTTAQLRRKYKGMMPHNNNKGEGSFRNLFIFGELLLNHIFVVFDREQRRLGFAPAVAQVLPSSSSSSSSILSPQLAVVSGVGREKVGKSSSSSRSGGGGAGKVGDKE